MLTVTEQKPIEEIMNCMDRCQAVYLIGCGTCATALHTGGKSEVVAMKKTLEDAGLKATGFNPKTGLVEIVEIEDHPWFVGVQYHPEYKSTVLNPHPLFMDFVKAASLHKE